MFTKEAGGLLGFFKSNDSYDPDRLAADQQKLRAFYLTAGLCRFPRRFGARRADARPRATSSSPTWSRKARATSSARSRRKASLRDFNADIDQVAGQDQAGRLVQRQGGRGHGHRPQRSGRRPGLCLRRRISPTSIATPKSKLMNITFQVGETPRVYVERIDIQGNTVTRDKVIRREFRVNEGDAFNAFKVKRSQDRIQSLGFFQENLEIKQTQGSTPRPRRPGPRRRGKIDRRAAAVGRLFEPREVHHLGLDRAAQFHGQGPDSSAPASIGRVIRKSVQLGFTEPYLFDKNDPARRRNLPPRLQQLQLSSATTRNTTYAQTVDRRRPPARLPGHRIRQLRHALFAGRRTRSRSTRALSITDLDGDRPARPSAIRAKAGTLSVRRTGQRLTSSIGYSSVYRQHQRHPRDARPADHLEPGFRRPWRRRQISPHAALDATKYFALPQGLHPLDPWRRRLHPPAAEVAGRRPGRRSGITDRFFGAADARLRHSRHRSARRPHAAMTPMAPLVTDDDEQDSATRSAAGPITWAGSKSNSRSVRSCAALAFARRPSSTSARCGS